MRYTYILLTLCAVLVGAQFIVSRDPERAAQLSQMYRDAAFTGETRQMVLMGLAVAIGAFVVYLTMTRR